MSKAASESIVGKILAARRALRLTDWNGSDGNLCCPAADRHGYGALDLLAVMARRLNGTLDRVEP